jgi:hypothetical protein
MMWDINQNPKACANDKGNIPNASTAIISAHKRIAILACRVGSQIIIQYMDL